MPPLSRTLITPPDAVTVPECYTHSIAAQFPVSLDEPGVVGRNHPFCLWKEGVSLTDVDK